MTTAGIIAEFNPFHNGHCLLIERAREAGADRIVVLMSGDYVQRGEPAVIDRETRARMALLSGADLVLAYPTRFATSSAESFAGHAVQILNGLGCIDLLVFGSECGDLGLLMPPAAALADESPEYREQLHRNLKSGMNFAKARAEALPGCADVLNSPNNILGVEYLKALIRSGSPIRPVTVKREGAAYLDDRSISSLPSAAAVRRCLKENASAQWERVLREMIPAESLTAMLGPDGSLRPVSAEDYSVLLIDRLLGAGDPGELTGYADVTADLANTFYNMRNRFAGFQAFTGLCRSKAVTASHVSRALLHIALQIRNDPQLDSACLTQVLGFRKEAQEVVSQVRKKAVIPVIMNPASELQALAFFEKMLFLEEVRVTGLYDAVRAAGTGRAFRSVLSKELIKV